MKKVLLITFVLIFALNGLCFAAKSSSSRPASRPSSPTTTAPAGGYKPSAPANTYTDKAPLNRAAATTQAPQQSTGSSWMRNVGMLAGGMMLGGMLSSMLGHGSTGMLADIMGLLISLVPILILVMLGRFLWIRYKSKPEKQPVSRF